MKNRPAHPRSGAALRKPRGAPVRGVWPARAGAATNGLTRILVPVDFSAGSETALRLAASLAQLYQARVLPMHVTPPIRFTVDCGYGPVNRTVPDAESLRRTRRRLRKLVLRSVPTELAEEATVCSGDPIEDIVRTATERQAGLIIMLAHDILRRKATPVTHTVDHLVRRVRCPVLVVHADKPSRKRPSSKGQRKR